MIKHILVSSLTLTSAHALDRSGTLNLTFNDMRVSYKSGGYCEDGIDPNCTAVLKLCNDVQGNFYNTSAHVSYDIDKTTHAEIVYEGFNIGMSSMGVAGKYGFVSRSIPVELKNQNVKTINFVISKDFENYFAQILFAEKFVDYPDYNCVIVGH